MTEDEKDKSFDEVPAILLRLEELLQTVVKELRQLRGIVTKRREEPKDGQDA